MAHTDSEATRAQLKQQMAQLKQQMAPLHKEMKQMQAEMHAKAEHLMKNAVPMKDLGQQIR